MFAKQQLVFDTTAISDSDSVGAFIRSSDGTLIDHETINAVERLSVDSTLKDGAGTALTSTLVGGKQGLDVNVIEGINVEVDSSHVDDSIALGDGTNLLTSTTVGSDIGLDVYQINDSSVANTAVANAANTLSVADTAQDVVSSPLASRKYLAIHNMDNKKVYIGSTGVSAANGFPLFSQASVILRAGEAIDLEFVGSSGATPEIRTLELS